MGNQFEISLVAEEEELASEWIQQGFNHIKEIEYLLTTYSDTSDLYRINAAAGVEPVVVHKETFGIIERSLQIPAVAPSDFRYWRVFSAA